MQMIRYEAARNALIEARSVDEVKDIRDKAEALRMYAKQAGDVGLQNMAAEIKLRAERKAGEMLAERDMAKGTRGQGRPPIGGDTVSPPKDQLQTLSDLGISKMQSHRWQDATNFSQRLATLVEMPADLRVWDFNFPPLGI